MSSSRFQASLFGVGSPLVDCRLTSVRREPLSESAWIDYLPNWVEGADALFQSLRSQTQWEHHSRVMYERVVDVPRLTAPPPDDPSVNGLLNTMANALSQRYGQALTSISLAYYRDGRDSVAPHGDKIGLRCADPIVAIVSVGAPRRFLLKPKAGGPGRRFSLGWGDLLVMGGSCQRTWLHGVPKTSFAEPRISIMFRPDLDALTDADQAPPSPLYRKRGAVPPPDQTVVTTAVRSALETHRSY